MAHYENVRTITAESGEDLTGDLYKFGVFDSTGRVVVNTTANGVVDGIIGEEVDAAGKAIALAVPDGGKMKVVAGAAVTRGALVMSDNAGRAIAFVDASDNVCMGRALQAAANPGEIITIQFVHKRTGVT